MAHSNPAIIYKQLPKGMPVAGQDLTVEDVPIPSEAGKGGLLVQVLYNSLDPYLRGMLRDPSIKSYFPAFETNSPIKAGVLAKVLKSDNEKFSEGDIVRGLAPVQKIVSLSAEETQQIQKLDADPNDTSFDFRHWLGALGMPGLTAYSSFYEIGRPKRGETIFISSAAGAVGQIVGQLAKHEGLTVIGSVGSDDKVKFVTEELKFDAAFNYKKETPHDALKRLAPNGIDIYYENVGAEHLDAALQNMNTFGRIAACGMIAEYSVENAEDRYGHKNLMLIVGKQLKIEGFLVGANPNFGPKYAAEHVKNVMQWLKDGSFIGKLHEDDISKGDEAFVSMLKGGNFGKAIVKVS